MVLQDFFTFMIEKNIFNLMISTIIGTAISGLAAELINQLVKPITKRFLNRNDEIKINYFGAHLEIDQIINKSIEFTFILFLSFGIFRLIDVVM